MVRFFAVGPTDAMRLVIADLQIERLLTSGHRAEPGERGGAHLLATPAKRDRVHPAARRDLRRGTHARLVVDAHQRCGIARLTYDLPQMPLIRPEIPGEIGVGQAEDAGAVRVTPGEERGTRRAALWRGAERLREAHAVGGERVERRGLHRLDPIGAEETPEVVAGEHQDIRSSVRSHRPIPHLQHSGNTPTQPHITREEAMGATASPAQRFGYAPPWG